MSSPTQGELVANIVSRQLSTVDVSALIDYFLYISLKLIQGVFSALLFPEIVSWGILNLVSPSCNCLHAEDLLRLRTVSLYYRYSANKKRHLCGWHAQLLVRLAFEHQISRFFFFWTIWFFFFSQCLIKLTKKVIFYNEFSKRMKYQKIFACDLFSVVHIVFVWFCLKCFLGAHFFLLVVFSPLRDLATLLR